MKVGIIGAGSIGLLFASYISRVFDVTIYTRTMEQADAINSFGILLRKGSEETKSRVKALPITDWMGKEAITIIAVKQYQLSPIIEKINNLQSIPENLLFLQNGMGHLKLLERIQTKNLYVGSVEHGALKENSYTVSHNGEGTTNVAVYKGDSGILQVFISSVPAEFPVALKDNYLNMLLNKLIVNAVINPLTAILRVKNGALIQNPFYFHTFNNLFAEITFILQLESQEEYLERVIDICRKTADNHSSMLKDMEAGRLTEVDAILGFLLEEAKKLNKPAPLVESLYYLIKGKEIGKEELF